MAEHYTPKPTQNLEIKYREGDEIILPQGQKYRLINGAWTLVTMLLLALLFPFSVIAQPAAPTGLIPGMYYVIVTPAGTGTGTVSGVGINCGADCFEALVPGATEVLTATPTGTSTFTGWSGDCTGTGTCTVIMGGTRNVTATFTAPTAFALSVTITGSGAGTVTSNPAGINCPGACSASFTSGSTVVSTAFPNINSVFNGWSGDCTGTGTCTVVMSVARNITASFSPSVGNQIFLAWTDTNVSPSQEAGTKVYSCGGDRCTSSTGTGTLLGTTGLDVTTFNYTEQSTGIRGYEVQATGTSPSDSGFSVPIVYASWHNSLCPCTIWPSISVPGIPANNDPQAVELGLKFKSESNGYIKGIRFYKSTTNTGTHTGKLYTSAGTLLASVIFTGETASGWQQMLFASPVAITAGTTYVASYHTTSGFYSVDVNYFVSPFYGPPLRVTGGSNGVFLYGAGGFPTNTFNNSNYWVDVIFDTSP